MIIDIISLWIGRILILSVSLTIITFCLWYTGRKLELFSVYFKALCYDIFSKKKKYKDLAHKIDIRLGRKWMVKYKNKWITWEIVEIKENDK